MNSNVYKTQRIQKLCKIDPSRESQTGNSHIKIPFQMWLYWLTLSMCLADYITYSILHIEVKEDSKGNRVLLIPNYRSANDHFKS